MNVKISAVIITLNEAKNIGRCIDSLKGVADEIVVVDSGSTDQTQAIAEAKGAKVILHAFEGYIEQKNYAITQASSHYVLSLDADEALSPELARSIQQVKATWQADGYSFNRLTNYCGHWVKHGGWYPDRKLRLWDSRKGSWTGINPHDVYKMQEGCTLKHISGDLLHYSFYSMSDHLKVIDKFTDIQARELYQRRKKVNLYRLRISPTFKFLRDYVFRFGFLDGFHGYCIAILSAKATFIKYAKLKLLYLNDVQR